ncbi:protein-S-isoprenylcysteine O-methyltransferase Ste14 [Leifsonia sp. EB34]
MKANASTKRERQWSGFALGVAFVLIGVVPGILSGWQHVNYIFAVGGAVIAVGNLIWILWSRRQARHEPGSDTERRPGDE